MYAAIRGLGEWVPETVRENDAWASELGAPRDPRADRVLADARAGTSSDLCDQIVARHLAREANDPFLGTTRRRVADDRLPSWQAETLAARAALEDARIAAHEIDVVMAYAAVPDHISPPSAPRVAHEIGAHAAYAPGVHTACASGVVQLELAAALIESGRARTVLIVQSFLMTRVFPLVHPASPNIGDGATAIVVGRSAERGIMATHAVSHGGYYDSVLWRRRDDDSRWFEAGGPMFLSTNDGAAAQRLISSTVRFAAQTVQEVLARAELSTDDLGAIACVQPRRWVPAAVAETLGVPTERAPNTFAERAHLGACGIVTNLLEARRRGLLVPGTLVALYGQGAGFTRAAGLVRWGVD